MFHDAARTILERHGPSISRHTVGGKYMAEACVLVEVSRRGVQNVRSSGSRIADPALTLDFTIKLRSDRRYTDSSRNFRL